MQHDLTMLHSAANSAFAADHMLSVHYAVLPKKGEDSFMLHCEGTRALLCVADGCGGLGGKRYEQMGDHTGAYIASRIVAGAFTQWVKETRSIPQNQQEGQAFLSELQQYLHAVIVRMALKSYQSTEVSRIVGSMQRTFPTTLCMAIVEKREADGCECCFVWAGDSRGYVLDQGGLHQYTKDDVLGEVDSFESLYRDVPLSNYLCADLPVRLSLRRTQTTAPSIILCATDGSYGCLPTPMEFEMLLLSTMRAASSFEGWQRKMRLALGKLAQDDATLLCLNCGFECFDDCKDYFHPRYQQLKAQFIVPVRAQNEKIEIAREKWLEYKKNYDMTEGAEDEQANWRI